LAALHPPEHPRFLIRSSLGRGAKGVVYRAFDRELEQEVALKALPCAIGRLSHAEVRSIKDEFRSLAVIAHPNLVQLYELFVSEDHCFYTMELVRGISPLERTWGGEAFAGSVDHAFLRKLLRQLASALSVIHAQNQVHRDIKPSNLLVDASDRVVLLDFGLVARPRAGVREIAGTLPYMSPEQRSAEPLTSAADWYGVGAVLHEALTGQFPPADGVPARPRLRGAPRDLAGLTAELLRETPARRPSGPEVLRRLDALRAGSAASAPGYLPTLPVQHFAGRQRELEQLQARMRSGRASGLTLLGVQGESGIGKTALIERLLAELAQAEPHMLQLRSVCRDQESIPFRAIDGWLDELSDCPRSALAAKLRNRRIPFRAELCRVFPVLAGLHPSSQRARSGALPDDPGELRRRAFASLRTTLRAVARARPLVLWIDDAHWGDPDSAAFVQELIRSNPPSCSLIVSYRGDEAQGSPFLAALADELRGHTFEVGPLSDQSSRELVAALVGEAAETLVDPICASASGSPFLIGERAHALSSRGEHELADVSDCWISARLGALTSAQRAILEVAALSKWPLAEEVLLAAAGLPKADRTQILALQSNRLVRRRPIAGAAGVQAYDERTRDTVLARIAPGRRTALHGTIAGALEGRPSTAPEVLAFHFAGAGDLDQAAHYAEIAGDRSAAAFAFYEAAELFRQSLEWSPGGREHERNLVEKRWRALASSGYGGQPRARSA
jgi:eukaryotic-like serine/threonine-protein kinase